MHKKISILVLALVVLCCGTSTSFASGFYVAPKAGGLIALDESNADLTAGITLGYRWVKLVALEASYSRIFSTVDNNFLDLNLVVSGYRSPIFWPYALVGAGVGISTASNADPEPLFRIGGGTLIRLHEYVKPFVQLSYVNLDLDNHFIEPQIGLSFGL